MSWASMQSLPAARASGNITPCRVIKYSGGSTGITVVLDDSATPEPVGVSCEGVRNPPGTASDDGYIAISGENVCFKGRGQMATAIVGTGGVTAGSKVISDANAAVILIGAVTQGWYVGTAQDTASAGDKVQIYVDPAPIGN